jgi:methionyl-tRNA synthetase
MSKTFYVTTPIYYVNSHPHLGHLYTTIIADTVARYKRQRGFDTYFLTGTDEHGINIERAAEKAGLPVKQHVDNIVNEFQTAFADYNFTNNHWIRTTDDYHKKGVAELWRRVRDNGYIYKGSYEGWYCGSCNEFYNESDAVKNTDGVLVCPTHTVTPLDFITKEESYFFKLSAFQDRLLEYYEKNPNFIRPEVRRNEVISFVSGGLKDLSVSRTSVKWGIPVPDDPEHTMYVWFDALSNYITAMGYGKAEGDANFNKYWPANLQLVGKDILRFHTVYWPAFLLAAGIEPAHTCFAHGMWLSGGRKMSKTDGNVIDLSVLAKHFQPDTVRYFALREMSFGNDGDFTYEALLDRVTADLASGLGNLSNRTLTMIRNFFEGVIPDVIQAVSLTNSDLVARAAEVKSAVANAIEQFDKEFDEYNFSRGLESVWQAIAVVDKFISDAKPWDIAKDEARRAELALVLHTSVDALRNFIVLLAPVLPTATQSIWQQLGELGNVAEIAPNALAPLKSGTHIGEIEGVFPRLDKKKVMSEIKQEEAASQEARAQEIKLETPIAAVSESPAPPVAPEGIAYIGIEDFLKVELRVGQILTAEPVPKADKLLRFTIDLGEPEPRQVLAGIAQYYEAEKLIGRKVIVVANLAPRKLRGFESQGMILAASIGDEGKPVLAGFLEDIPNGAKLK